jgi:excisionase family DNA binding protein
MNKEILVAREVADILRVDVQRIYSMIRDPDNDLPFILLGQRQYRFSKQAVEQWLENGGNAKNVEVKNDK